MRTNVCAWVCEFAKKRETLSMNAQHIQSVQTFATTYLKKPQIFFEQKKTELDFAILFFELNSIGKHEISIVSK